MSICQSPEAISENVRVELARGRRSARHMQRACGISRTRWDRRMTEPRTWTLGELCDVAAELNIPIDRLLQEDR